MVTIGNFEIDRRIGAGGMADVWLAHSLSDGHPVAIKTLRITSQDKLTDMEARFAAEVQSIAGLVHPGIVAIYDHGQLTEDAADATFGGLKAGAPWLAMEYCEGGDLGDAEVSSWSELHAIATTLLEALALTHASGVLHRDLKPGNLLVSQRDGATQIKVADFGLVRTQEMAAQITQAGQTVGTPSYMAPEQILQLRHRFGPPTDLYSAAALLWSLAAGAPPFTHYRDNLTALLKAQVNEDPPALMPSFALPIGFEAWLRRLLSKHPQRRYLFAADALAAMPGLREPCLHYPAAQKSDEALVSSSTKVMVPADLEAPKKDGYGAIFEAARPVAQAWPDSLTVRQEALTGTGLGLYRIKRIPVVGRRAERDALWQALRGVSTARKPQGILLNGLPGSGRRRLAGWIGRIAHRQAIARVATARAGMELGPGYALTRAIGGLLGIEAKMAPALVTRAISEHLVAFAAAADPEEQRILEQTFAVIARSETMEEAWASQPMRLQALLRVVERLSRHRSLVLVFESIENDRVAIEFVDQIFAQPSMPVLVVATADQRVVSSRHTAAHRLKALQSEGHLKVMQIAPLAEANVQTLLNGLLGMEASLVQGLARRSAGNPGFAIGLLDHLVDTGMLTIGQNGLALIPGRSLDLPADLDALVAARMHLYCEDLSQEERLGLSYSAVLGRRVNHEEWQQACQAAEIEPPAQVVSRFARVGLIELGEQGWRFADAAGQQHLLDDLERSGALEEAHRHCGEALQAVLAPSDPLRDQRIGLHLAAGNDPSAAVLLRDAAGRAKRLGDRASLTVLATAFERLVSSHSSVLTLPGLGEIIDWRIQTKDFGSIEAAEAWADAFTKQHGDTLSAEYHQVVRLKILRLRDDLAPNREAHIAALKEHLHEETHPYSELLARARLGYILNTRGRSQEALPHFERSARLALAQGQIDTLCFCLQQLGYAHFYLRNNAKAVEMAGRALKAASPYPGTWYHLGSLYTLAELLDLGGAHDQATTRLNELAKTMRRDRGPLDAPTTLATARNLFMTRRYQEAHHWLYEQEALPPAKPGAIFSCWRANLLLACKAGIKDIDGAKAAFEALKTEQALSSEAPAEMALLSERIGEVLKEHGAPELAAAVYRYARERYIEAGWSDHAESLSARMKGA